MAQSKILMQVQGNGSSTTLSSSISNSDTSAPLTSDTAFQGEGMVLIDEGQPTEEFAYATGKVGSSLTTLLDDRGLEGGSPQAHSASATVKGIITAGMWNNVIAAVSKVVSATTGALLKATGATINTGTDDATIVTPKALADSNYASLPTASSTTTFTNKTLTSPKINEDVALTATSTQINSATSGTGWIVDSDTWVYVGSHSFKITGKDVTSKFPIGTRIRYKQGGSYEYGVVIGSTFSTDTTVTLAPNNDYALASATITDAEYSYQENPQGYPDWFAFTPTYDSLTEGSGASVGLFKINGKELKFKTKFTFAADSSVTGTPIRWSNAIGTINTVYDGLTQIGYGTAYDANGGSNRLVIDKGGNLFTDYATTGAYANTSSTSPFTWTTSDRFEFQGWYILV